MPAAEGRNDQQRNPKSRIQKIAHWTARSGTAVIGYVEGMNAIRTDSWLRRHIIVEAAELVPCEDEHRVLPRGAIHQLIDESGNVFCANLHAAARRSGIRGGREAGAEAPDGEREATVAGHGTPGVATRRTRATGRAICRLGAGGNCEHERQGNSKPNDECSSASTPEKGPKMGHMRHFLPLRGPHAHAQLPRPRRPRPLHKGQ